MSGVSPERSGRVRIRFRVQQQFDHGDMLPLAQATESAVAPYSFAALTFACARIRRSAISRSLRSAASISAVEPSG